MGSQSFVETEIATQPADWPRAAAVARERSRALPTPGQSVAVTGCGTSWFMAMAYAALREAAGQGRTDAFPASELPLDRDYDRVLAISRSGTTTEVVDVLKAVACRTSTTAITTTAETPACAMADESVLLPFADERSIVQTRFATSALALLRASLGEDLTSAGQDATTALTIPLGTLVEAEQITFLGRGWTVGLAHEAALKLREAACAWTESYPAMEYRHGPVAIAQPGRVVWMFGAAPLGLAEEVAATGAAFVESALDPMAHLVLAQHLAVAIAHRRGLNPDRPRNLTRSVILTDTR